MKFFLLPLLALASAVTLGACEDPEYEVAYKAYDACLKTKGSVEACQLEKADFEAKALRAQVGAQRAAAASRVPPSTYTPPPVYTQTRVYVPPPAYMPPIPGPRF